MFNFTFRPLQKTKVILLFILSILTLISILLIQRDIAFSQDIANVARQITVRVEGAEPGSGVIIGQQNNTYYVLTAKHVVSYPDNYAVVTPDGSVHPVADIDIRRIPEVDLAVLGFTSEREYTVATVGDSDLATLTTSIWVAGFPLPGRENTSIFHITSGEITARPLIPNGDGYGLTYSNKTRAGMSGGPVLNAQGHLIGIHGLREAESSPGEDGITVSVNDWTNLGIPINIFRTVAPLMEVELALADPADTTTEDESANCVEQLRYRDIATTDGPDDDGLWRYPVSIIGPNTEEASLFGPGDVPGSSMQAVGCRVGYSGFLGSKATWRCPEDSLRVEAMSAAQAHGQCNGTAPADPTPLATARREEVRRLEAIGERLASICRPFRADHDYWEDKRFSCSFDDACRAEADAGKQEAERQWNAAGCRDSFGPIWSAGNFNF